MKPDSDREILCGVYSNGHSPQRRPQIANRYCDVDTAVHRMLAMIGSIEKGLIIWREAGWCAGEEYARLETMTRERRAAEPPRSVSKMQSAVTNGADSRAHRILDAAISAGLAPEGNLAIAERGKGRRNRPYKSGSTVAPFVTAIYPIAFIQQAPTLLHFLWTSALDVGYLTMVAVTQMGAM